MAEEFDVAVIGLGPGGEAAATRLLSAGKTVVAIERELVGGECAYWACIPSKTVLRPAEAVSESARAAGVSGQRLNWEAVREYRDSMARRLDDSAQVKGYQEQGAEVVRGAARFTGPHSLRVGDRDITAEHIVIATGSTAFVPPLEGIDDITVWTNREIYTTAELPQSAVIVGGSAVGVEAATFLAGFGVRVAIVQRGNRLIDREEPRVGELAQRSLEEAGVDVHVGATVAKGRKDGDLSVLELDTGAEVSAPVVILGAGRSPRTADLGLDAAGLRTGANGEVTVDDRCRAAEGVWALGDVTGIMPFTHVAKYQGRIVAANILGGEHTASYAGIPRVVFANPEIAGVGLTTGQAKDRGLRTVSAEIDLAQALARPWTYEQNPSGYLGLLADADEQVLVGAWALGPLASEWIHQASLAIRAEIPLEVLREQVPQFPTYQEAYSSALDLLDA